MSIGQSLLTEFDQEMAGTRRVLERTPVKDAAWRPHPKSYTLGKLVTHIANLPTWINFTLEQTELDISPAGGANWGLRELESTTGLLATFDENVTKARAAIAKASDADFAVNWSLKAGGHTIFTLPRVAVLRSFVMNHLIHHRAQYTVYLRLRDVPVPQLYGPTADEQ